MKPEDPILERVPQQLPSAIPDVALWWSDLDVRGEDLHRLAATLAAAEHARAARFGTDALRTRWIAGRAALRIVLARSLRMAPADVPIVRGARGRPELSGLGAGIDFNVSHTGSVALIGVLHTAGRDVRIGVDLEREARAVAADRLARKVLTEGERAAIAGLAADDGRRAFLRYWTCKEAMSKATGDGLRAPFRHIDLELSPAPRVREGPSPYRPPGWTLVAAPVPDGHLATVALWDRQAMRAG